MTANGKAMTLLEERFPEATNGTALAANSVRSRESGARPNSALRPSQLSPPSLPA